MKSYGVTIQMKPLQQYRTLNPLSPKTDQHQFSPHNINTLSKEKVIRFIKMITSGKML